MTTAQIGKKWISKVLPIVIGVIVIGIVVYTGKMMLEQTKYNLELFCEDKAGIVDTCDYIDDDVLMLYDCYTIDCDGVNNEQTTR